MKEPIYPDVSPEELERLKNDPKLQALLAGTPVKLGDRLEKTLSGFGITKENYKILKAAVGLPKDCNCQERQKWLNEVPAAFLSGGIKAAKKAHESVKEYYAKPR